MVPGTEVQIIKKEITEGKEGNEEEVVERYDYSSVRILIEYS